MLNLSSNRLDMQPKIVQYNLWTVLFLYATYHHIGVRNQYSVIYRYICQYCVFYTCIVCWSQGRILVGWGAKEALAPPQIFFFGGGDG